MRLIDADALLYDLEIVPLTGDGGVDINDLEEIIKRQPTIDPVKHGRWIESKMPVTGCIESKCSVCGVPFYTAFRRETKYCPNCGSRMDEGSEEE